MTDSATEAAVYVVIEDKADVPFCTAYARFWPKADITVVPFQYSSLT
jgi:hypothetical protein